jgi:hypothetical protein
MRLFALMAAFALVSIPVAQAGEPRSLSGGVDQKLPDALGKAAEAPKLVEAPKPPDPVVPPAPPQTVVAPPAAPAAPPAQADPAQAAQPAFVPRPSLGASKPDDKAGQVTFEDSKPSPPVAAPPKQAKAEKPRRKRAHWDEARIMREIYRYGGYAGMIGGW